VDVDPVIREDEAEDDEAEGEAAEDDAAGDDGSVQALSGDDASGEALLGDDVSRPAGADGDTSGVDPASANPAVSQTGAGPSDLDQADTTLAASTPLQGLLYPEEIPASVSDRCGRCHGADGAGRGLGAFPRLAGQRPEYLLAALRAYAEGERHSGIMQPVAAGLGEEEMREIALFYSRLTTSRAAAPRAGVSGAASARESMGATGATSARPSAGGTVDTLAVRRGERIAHEGLPRERVPACAGCHGPSALPKNPFYPILAGQYADYIALQLDLFKEDRRGGSAYSRLMHPTADELTEEQVRDVALYYGSLGSDLEQTGAAATDTTR
jgi:cytochrome c553